MSDTSLIELIEDCTLFGGTFPNERIEEAREFFRKQKPPIHLPVVSDCCLCGSNFTPSVHYPNDTACNNCHEKLRGY